jgi:hypothetical protein
MKTKENFAFPDAFPVKNHGEAEHNPNRTKDMTEAPTCAAPGCTNPCRHRKHHPNRWLETCSIGCAKRLGLSVQAAQLDSNVSKLCECGCGETMRPGPMTTPANWQRLRFVDDAHRNRWIRAEKAAAKAAGRKPGKRSVTKKITKAEQAAIDQAERINAYHRARGIDAQAKVIRHTNAYRVVSKFTRQEAGA